VDAAAGDGLEMAWPVGADLTKIGEVFDFPGNRLPEFWSLLLQEHFDNLVEDYLMIFWMVRPFAKPDWRIATKSVEMPEATTQPLTQLLCLLSLESKQRVSMMMMMTLTKKKLWSTTQRR